MLYKVFLPTPVKYADLIFLNKNIETLHIDEWQNFAEGKHTIDVVDICNIAATLSLTKQHGTTENVPDEDKLHINIPPRPTSPSTMFFDASTTVYPQEKLDSRSVKIEVFPH